MAITNEQRAAYTEAAACVAAIEKDVEPKIKAIEAEAGLPAARAILDEITDEIGEPFDSCIFCGILLFDDDETASGEDGDHACRPCADRWREENPEAAAEIDAARGEAA